MSNRETPDPNERPTWPPLFAQLLHDKHCLNCKTELRPDAIIGLGGQIILARHAPYAGPVTFVILLCPHCRLVQTRVTPAPQDVVLEAMAQLYAWGRRLTAHPKQQSQDDAAEPDARMDPPEGAFLSDRPSPVRPSLRHWQPRHPFSEAEIVSFLRKLAKTSFKVQSKSFRRFLKRFGLDPDKPPEDEIDPDKPPF